MTKTRGLAATDSAAGPAAAASGNTSGSSGERGLVSRLLACCCGGTSSLDDVVFVAEMAARNLRAGPPVELEPGYANEENARRGMAPPESGIFEVVNKSKHPNEIIAVLISDNAADVALHRPPGSASQLRYLRQGLVAANTVLHGHIAADAEWIEVAVFHGCHHTSVMAVRAAVGPDGDIADCFRSVKAYRIRCRDKNVLLKYKDGSGLQVQSGEAGIGRKNRRSVGGGIDMKTNVASIELVRP